MRTACNFPKQISVGFLSALAPAEAYLWILAYVTSRKGGGIKGHLHMLPGYYVTYTRMSAVELNIFYNNHVINTHLEEKTSTHFTTFPNLFCVVMTGLL